MRNLVALILASTFLLAEYDVTHSEPKYDVVSVCVDVQQVSPAGTAVGGVVGGATGAVVGHALFGRGFGSLLGGLVGTGVGAEVGGSSTHKECTQQTTLVGYYNYYIMDGLELIEFSKERLLKVR